MYLCIYAHIHLYETVLQIDGFLFEPQLRNVGAKCSWSRAFLHAAHKYFMDTIFAQHSNSKAFARALSLYLSPSLTLSVSLVLSVTLSQFLCFCRYSPLTPPTTNWFPVKGVTIADGSSHCNQFICNVELEKLNIHSSGQYRCEVSGDAPEFELIDKAANMTVGGMYKKKLDNLYTAHWPSCVSCAHRHRHKHRHDITLRKNIEQFKMS